MQPRDDEALARAKGFLAAYGADLEHGRAEDLAHYLGGSSGPDAQVVSEIWEALHGARLSRWCAGSRATQGP
jgi:hypothetical protein